MISSTILRSHILSSWGRCVSHVRVGFYFLIFLGLGYRLPSVTYVASHSTYVNVSLVSTANDKSVSWLLGRDGDVAVIVIGEVDELTSKFISSGFGEKKTQNLQSNTWYCRTILLCWIQKHVKMVKTKRGLLTCTGLQSCVLVLQPPNHLEKHGNGQMWERKPHP